MLNVVLTLPCPLQRSALSGSGSNVEPGRFLWQQSISFVKRDQRIFLRFGLLPVVWDLTAKDETLAAYALLYLKEEDMKGKKHQNKLFYRLQYTFYGRLILILQIRTEGKCAGNG